MDLSWNAAEEVRAGQLLCRREDPAGWLAYQKRTWRAAAQVRKKRKAVAERNRKRQRLEEHARDEPETDLRGERPVSPAMQGLNCLYMPFLYARPHEREFAPEQRALQRVLPVKVREQAVVTGKAAQYSSAGQLQLLTRNEWAHRRWSGRVLQAAAG